MVHGVNVCRLTERIKNHPQMEREGGLAFIESLTELLRRLLDYRTVQLGDRDLHMHVMFNLLVRAGGKGCGWGVWLK